MPYCPVEELIGVRARMHDDRRQKERAGGDTFVELFEVLVPQGTCQWGEKGMNISYRPSKSIERPGNGGWMQGGGAILNDSYVNGTTCKTTRIDERGKEGWIIQN